MAQYPTIKYGMKIQLLAASPLYTGSQPEMFAISNYTKHDLLCLGAPEVRFLSLLTFIDRPTILFFYP